MSCEYCTDIYEGNEEAAVFNHCVFRDSEYALCSLAEPVDGHKWWLAIESDFFTSVPVEHCPWCGRKLEGDAG